MTALYAPAPLTLPSFVANGHLDGIVRLPDEQEIVWGIVAVRYENDVDWSCFYPPHGALTRTEPAVGAYPFDADSGETSLALATTIDDWLAGVASQFPIG